MHFAGLLLLIGLVVGCSPEQSVPVRIGYVETDVPSSNQCVEITFSGSAVLVTNGIFSEWKCEL